MVYFGIIPFLHRSYGPTDLPPFLYVDSPRELKDKIAMLESNQPLHDQILRDCQALLKDDYFTGSYLRSELLKALRRIGIDTAKESVEPGLQNQLSMF
jgi:hypothetical protein